MYKYDLSLSNTITKNGTPFMSSSGVWNGIDGDLALPAMLGLINSVHDAVVKASNKSGPLSIVLSLTTTALDGGPVPPGANAAETVSGITLHGLADIEQAMHTLSGSLLKMGRDWANTKEGMKKGK